MSSVTCRFCAHANPAGARFCNDCGSPLDFKPCPNCEAVNDARSDRCHQCGLALAPQTVASASALTPPIASAPDAMAGRREASDNVPIALAERVAAGSRGATSPEYRAPPEHRIVEEEDPVVAELDRRERVAAYSERTPSFVTPNRIAALVIVLGIVGAGAYYAYLRGVPLPALDGADAPTASQRDGAPTTSSRTPATSSGAPAATSGGATATGAAVLSPDAATAARSAAAPGARAASQATIEPAAAAPPAGTQPASPRAEANAAAPPEKAQTAEPRSRARDTRDATRQGSTGARVDRDAIETQRLIERDLAGFVRAPDGNSGPQPADVPKR
jgi:hypothetical protein